MITMRDKRQKTYLLLLVACLAVVVPFLSGCMPSQPECEQDCAIPRSGSDQTPRGCTIFTVSHGDQAYFGGNSDWINFDSSYYWVDPGSTNDYGAIYFGVPDNVQQGFNEKGLAYDSNGLPLAPVNPHHERKPVYGSYASYPIQILRACATVEEVIGWVQTHQWHEAMHDQLHFADATGDAVVISAGPDGEVAFTRKPAGDGFLVSTNFNLANPMNGSYPCWRYTRAEELLKDIDNGDDLTAGRAVSILDAVHVESVTVWTVMSVVGDLPRGLVYVYFFHQFDAPIILNVADEIASAPEPGPLRDIFPPETVSRADQVHQRLMARSARCDAAGLTWLGLVVVSLAVLLLLVRPARRGLIVWVSVVAVLGPVGLLVWLITARGHRTSTLLEDVGDLPPYVVGMVAALLAAVFVPGISQNTLLQLLAFYGLPLTIGLFLYQAPLLACATRSGYVRTVLCRLPAVLVSTNLALAGLFAISLPLIKLHLNYCGFSTVTFLPWWATVVLGALAGGLLLYAYHAWAIRRGFVAWSALLRGTDEGSDGTPVIFSPSWRRLWLWLLLSFVALIAGIALGAVGSMLAEGVR